MMLPKLQYISQGITPRAHLEAIQRVLDFGVSWVQLRLKEQPQQVVQEVAHSVKKMCDTYSAVFIINDYPGIALETGADGVHLGQTDVPVQTARKLLGNKAMIGGTANSFADLMQRAEEGCDYIGLGPYRFTKTKQNLSPVLGPQGTRDLMASFRESGKQTPVYAIGGIVPDDWEILSGAGIYGVALSGFLTHADREQLSQCYELLNKH